VLVLPLAVLLRGFAADRRGRIEHALELSRTYRGTALLLGDVVEDDDAYTGEHTRGVVALALRVADRLGLGEEDRRLVEFGACCTTSQDRRAQGDLHKPGR
jgi:HD-GYP domain-containing protein (c-di-GMP phosphodiesterase class II)